MPPLFVAQRNHVMIMMVQAQYYPQDETHISWICFLLTRKKDNYISQTTQQPTSGPFVVVG